MDMYRVNRLYPQYQRSGDRRQQSIPVAVERRSGKDRRSEDRVVLDKQLTKDLYDVKSKVSKLEALSPKMFENNITTQAPAFASMNNMTQDILVKESKPDYAEIARREAEIERKEATKFQVTMIAFALIAAIGLSMMSSAGAVIAIGTGLYVGARILKALIAKEIKNEDSKDK
ncbi:MAG: hypothetical protein E7Z90_03155 [Cyanobacteria bacterium SIG29]|nr:hypothetical protein [Cyanobacteria bacterium SIG29]